MATQRDNEIIKLYLVDGLTYQEIGDRYDVSRERVRQILRNNNVPIKREKNASLKMRAKKAARASQAYEIARWLMQNNTTKVAAAKRFGITPSRLHNLLDEFELNDPPRVATHGSRTMYNYGCHCEACRQANNEAQKEYYHTLPTWPSRPWTKEEEEYLKKHYATLGPRNLSTRMKRSVAAIQQHRIKYFPELKYGDGQYGRKTYPKKSQSEK